MAHVLKDIQSDSAWEHSTLGVQLYDGNPFMNLSVDVLPGFILIDITNRTAMSLLWVSCSITPIKGDVKIYSRWSSTSMQPSSRLVVPVAYSCDASCECTCLVTFRREIRGNTGVRLHICQTRAYLIPAVKDAFTSMSTWRTLIKDLTRREVQIPVGLDLTPRVIVDGIQNFLNGHFFPIAELGAIDTPLSWGCIDPLLMVTFRSSPSASIVFYGPDSGTLDQIVTDFTKWSGEGRIHNSDFFDLGVACTTLHDGLLLKTKTDYVRSAGRQVFRLIGILGLRVSLFSQLMDLLAVRESLEDLSEQERSLYERALAEIETQVIGRPL